MTIKEVRDLYNPRVLALFDFIATDLRDAGFSTNDTTEEHDEEYIWGA